MVHVAFNGRTGLRLVRPLFLSGLLALLTVPLVGCSSGTSEAPAAAGFQLGDRPEKLSAYAIFAGDPEDQQPAEGVIPYAINTPLFSDYTAKFRFVKLPEGQAAEYNEQSVLDFPVGTVIAKTFAYPHDLRDPDGGQRLLETRVLIHEPDGWVGLPYIWNDEQTDATLKVVGATIPVSWVHTDGESRDLDYLVPNKNQCAGCHKAEGNFMKPIGPKVRNLNGDFAYAHGLENQLDHWRSIGALTGGPAAAEDVPRVAVWDDPSSGTVDERARAWLDNNCAHCHNATGPARTSGLFLTVDERTPSAYGVFKTPVAAGQGSGGLAYDIVPGKPDESIMVYRISSTHPSAMMPELGKRLVHKEGVELIRQWVAEMEVPSPAAAAGD